MKFSTFKPKTRSGFSLVEMLVVIAVIGIISAIAIPSIGKVNESAKKASAKRNAQTIASISSSANAAGAWHVIPASLGGGVAMSIDVLVTGIKSPDMDLVFKIQLGSEQIAAADDFLEIANLGDEYVLQYKP